MIQTLGFSGAHETKAAIARGLCGLIDDVDLLGGHFFDFAFLPHEFQFALGFLEGGRDFLLHAGSGFFEFLRELDVAVSEEAESSITIRDPEGTVITPSFPSMVRMCVKQVRQTKKEPAKCGRLLRFG